MKKVRTQSAPAHHTAAAGAPMLGAPGRRRAARGSRLPRARRAAPSASATAESRLELGSALNGGSALAITSPPANRHEHPIPILIAEAPLPGALPPEEVELKLLIEAVYLQSGYDFSNYRRQLVQERVAGFLERERFKSLSALQAAILREAPVLERLLVCLTEHRTGLFAEPAFYKAFRQEIVLWLRTYPFARIWVAGCGSGGEAYSLAAVLREEGLQQRCRIYATDLCEGVVRQAQAGTWPLAELKRAAGQYRRAGGQHRFVDYYTAIDGEGHLTPTLTRNIVFAAHNLLHDASFNEFHLIVCRTVMEDFDPILQAQVHDLLYNSLVPRGVLALKSPHSLNHTLHQSDYESMLAGQGLYRKKRPYGLD